MPFRRIKVVRGKGRLSASGRVNSHNRLKKPIWDLYKDGVTYSYLSKFVICPERFRLHAVEGWTQADLKDGLEFGNAFHHCFEQRCKGLSVPAVIKSLKGYQQRRCKTVSDPKERQELEQLLGVVQVTYPLYNDHWEDFYRLRNAGSRLDPTRRATHQEEKFDVAIAVPGCPKRIHIRGKIDGIYRHPKTKRLWVLEHKTKGNIDEEGLQASLSQDLQTMLYVVAVEEMMKEKVEGVLYNVVRRSQLKLRQGDTLRAYLDRIDEDITKRPDWYFMRWETELEKGDVEYWKDRSLMPNMIRLVRWWESIKANPFDPWKNSSGKVNPEHWQRPFGVYDAANQGQRGDYFDLLTRNSTWGLYQRKEAFPELAEAV